METLFWLLVLVGLPGAIGFRMGHNRARKQAKEELSAWQSSVWAEAKHVRDQPVREDVARLMLAELDGRIFSDVLDARQRETLRDRYEAMLPSPQAKQKPVSQARPKPIPAMADQSVTVRGFARRREEASAPSPAAVPPQPARPATPIVTSRVSEPTPVSRPKPHVHRPRFEAKLDPAVMLLYLGALLVVAAGLIYASYAWSDLGPWQKLGLLIGATAAFIATGLVLWRKPRVAQAGETFLAIGALLVPTNAIAAYTVLEGAQARPELPLLIGAIATSVVHGAFSFQPGGRLYNAGSVIATGLAIATLPAALGAHASWGGPLLLLAAGLLPDPRARVAHLVPMWRLLSPVTLPVALALMVSGEADRVRWIIPGTLAALTVSLARFDRRWTPAHGQIAVVASFSAIGTAATVLREMEVKDEVIWATVAITMSFVWLAITAYGPAPFRRDLPWFALNIEAMFGLWFAAGAMLVSGSGWGFAVAALAGTLGSAFVTVRYRMRLPLLNAGLFVSLLYLAMLPFMDTSEGSGFDFAMFLMPLPLVLAVVAFQLDRGSRRAWPEGSLLGAVVWPLAALAIVPVGFATLFEAGESDTALLRRLSLEAMIYGVATLIAAWSLRRSWIRLVYGGFITAAIATFAFSTPLHTMDVAPVIFLALVAVSIPTIPTVASRAANRLRILAPLADPSPQAELRVFGAAAAVPLAAMVLVTTRYIVTGLAGANDDPNTGIGTWFMYLALFLALTVASVIAGSILDRRTGNRENSGRWLPVSALSWGTFSLALVARLATTDVMVWSWIVLVTGFVLANLTPYTRPSTPFTSRLRADAGTYGVVMLYGGLVWNLVAGVVNPSTRNDGVSAELYLGLGLVAILMATAPRDRRRLWEGLGAIGIGAYFATRALGGDAIGMAEAFTALAWLLALRALSFLQFRPVRWQLPSWIGAALTMQVIAIGFAGASGMTSPDTTLAITWTSLSIFLALAASLIRQPVFTLLAIGSGTIATYMIAGAAGVSGFGLSLWIVGYAWMLFAMAFAARGLQHPAWPPHVLANAGLLVHLVALASCAHTVTTEARWESAYLFFAIALGSLALMLGTEGTRRRMPLQTLAAQLTAIGGVAATVAAFGGDRLAIALALLLYGWLTTSTGIVLERTRHPAWPRQNGMNAGLVANLVGVLIPSLMLADTPSGAAVDGRIVLGLVSLAGLLGVDAYERRDRMLAVLASMTAVAALLYQIGTHDPSNIHAYTVPLAIYILSLGLLFRHTPDMCTPLLAIGSGVLVVPTLLEALDQETFSWLLFALAEGLGLFLGGLLLRLRVPIAAGVATVSLIVLRMLVDAVNAMPNWMSLAIAGLALLAVGTLWMSYRDELRDRAMHLRDDWVHLG